MRYLFGIAGLALILSIVGCLNNFPSSAPQIVASPVRAPTFVKIQTHVAPAPVLRADEDHEQRPTDLSSAQSATDMAVRQAATNRVIGLDRAQLVRDLQRELSRVGCYNGSLDGQWNGATRQSMGDFLARVNARLPLNEPDNILLALVRSHADHRDAKCRAGDGKSARTRNATLADSSQPSINEDNVSDEGRMGVGGPLPTTVETQPHLRARPPADFADRSDRGLFIHPLGQH